MKALLYFLGLFLSLQGAVAWASPNETVVAYLRLLYGDQSVDRAQICHPHRDLWMIGGTEPNNRMLEFLKQHGSRLKVEKTQIIADTLGSDLIFLEIRDGKVDPAFSLQSIYNDHRELLTHFLFASLTRDKEMLKLCVTNPENLDFGDVPVVAAGDMGIYNEVLELIPVVRTGDPKRDAESKSVEYRIPISKEGLRLRLVRTREGWQIDTNKKLTVPLGFFFR